MIQKVKEFAKSILDGIKNALGINSPSKVFRDEVGKWIPPGIAVGIEATTDEAVKAVQDMNEAVMDEMTKAVELETGKVNAKADIFSNNNQLTLINAEIAVDGEVDMDGTKVGRLVAPVVVKTIRSGGV